METAANVLDDATHSNLDKAVLAKFPNSVQPTGISGACLLLIFITLNSEGCIDPKYGGAVDVSFLEENPDLQAELWKAWEAKSFKHIRNLSKSPHLSVYNRTNTKCRNSSSSTTHNISQRCGISRSRERYVS
jgi:hypothetical protein